MPQRPDCRLVKRITIMPEPVDTTQKELSGLLERISKGDTLAFDAFYEAASPVLFSIAVQMLRDAALAEDVVQEAFVQIWERAAFYDPQRGKPLTWAITLTRNKAIDRLRSLQRRGRVFAETEQDQEPFDGESTHSDAASLLMESEGASIIRQYIKSLAPDERTILEMAFFSALTHSEIAEQLGQPLGTIKAKIRRSLLKLRAAMKDFL